MRLMTEGQYRQVISDLFGPDIVVISEFPPLVRTNGLLALGAREARITPAAFERYERRAQRIASQVLDEARRRAFLPCAQAVQVAADDACAREFIADMGRMLYRRPLSEAEIEFLAEYARDSTLELGSFVDGLGAALAAMLVSPNFLYVVDSLEKAPSGEVRLTAYAKASRLSFFLWNSAPDRELLAAADRGELHDARSTERIVDRMLAAPAVRGGVEAFFNDMLMLDKVDKLDKDKVIHPLFTGDVQLDARKQTLLTISSHLLDETGDYRALLTTRKTFLSGALGAFYRVRVPRPDGGWMPYEFAEGDPRAGLLSQVSFAALNSHAARSSPTLRGKAVREVLLCQKVPDPPDEVDFTLFNDPNAPAKTARDRLGVHSTVPTCAGCHKLTDPIGLAMETLNAVAQLRETENGAKIDTSGELDGVRFTNISEMATVLSQSPSLTACLVNRVLSYGLGRPLGAADREIIGHFEERFEDGAYRILPLLREIAISDAFFSVTAAREPNPEARLIK